MIPFTSPPDEGLFNSVMLEAKSFLHNVFEILIKSPSSISIVYTNDLCKDTLVLIDLIEKRREEICVKFPRINELTLIELEHLLKIRNERSLNFNSNIEDVVLISIILRRLNEVFLPTQNNYRVEFRRIEVNAMKKLSFVRNRELKEAESLFGLKEIKKRKERKKEQLCKGFPSGSLCLNMAVGKPEGKLRFVSLCKQCMTNRQTYIAKLRVTKERKVEEKEEKGYFEKEGEFK